jgi:D-lactate dehydrogenase
MKVAVFSTKAYDRQHLNAANQAAGSPHEWVFLEPRLTAETARLADGCGAVCAFVNDDLGRPVLEKLAGVGVRFIALRSAGFNHVDLPAAEALGLTVARVPAYSPHGVAEHAVALMLALNRHLHRAYHRIRDGDFRLDGLAGFEMKGKTAGVVGTGQIGAACCGILRGFGMKVLAFDVNPSDELKASGIEYVGLDRLLAESHVVSLHVPLMPATQHLINAQAIGQMRDGVMLINTSRGGLIDTKALIAGLKNKKLGSVGLDVYEEEEALFFEDRSEVAIDDDTFARLLTFPNVLITGHQAFLTEEALDAIAETTVGNLTALADGGDCENVVRP